MWFFTMVGARDGLMFCETKRALECERESVRCDICEWRLVIEERRRVCAAVVGSGAVGWERCAVSVTGGRVRRRVCAAVEGGGSEGDKVTCLDSGIGPGSTVSGGCDDGAGGWVGRGFDVGLAGAGNVCVAGSTDFSVSALVFFCMSSTSPPWLSSNKSSKSEE